MLSCEKNSVLKYPAFLMLEQSPLISATASRNKLNIDSTPRVYGALARYEYVACAAECADQD